MGQNIEQIIEGCKNYHAASQKALYEYCYPTMLGVCMRYTPNRDDAAAMYNEAMLKVLQHIEQYKNEGSPMAWVRRIVVNTCIDNCRKKSKFNLIPLSENGEEQVYVSNELENEISSEQVVEWLQCLPPSTNLVFNLYCLDGHTIDEVAEQLNITVGTAKWHVSEARKKLREQLNYLNVHRSNAK